MTGVTDTDLVREYLDRNSESAFADLVHRHINLVYSVSCRYVGDPDDARDVTQVVFMILARKAARLRHRTTLTGWLYETTRFAARQHLRTRHRRQVREQEAFMQSTLSEPNNESVWRQVAPLLEEAMTRLSEKERALVALRFFENKGTAETATLLGIKEWAARKRVERALDKLRRFFAKRGVNSTSTILAGAISANSVQAAPVMLAKYVSATALTKGVAGGSTLTLIKGTLKIMAWANAKTSVIIGVAVILAAGTTTTLVAQRQEQSSARTDFPKSSWVNAGRGNPAATIQTLAWAVMGNHGEAILECLSANYRMEFRKVIAQTKPGSSAEQVLLEMWRPQLIGSTSIRILGSQILSTNQVLLDLALLGGDKKADHWVRLQKFGDEWMVDDFNPKGKKAQPGVPHPEYGGVGLGLEFDPRTHTVRIAKVQPNSPAARAGLVPGLVLQKIDGTATTGKTLPECVFLSRGVAGTRVWLQMVNTESLETNTVELTRQKFVP